MYAFSHYFLLIVLLFQKTENERKDAGNGPFLNM